MAENHIKLLEEERVQMIELRRFVNTVTKTPSRTRGEERAEAIHKIRFVYNMSELPEIEGLKYQHVPGDGHCLFHAVGLYIGKNAESIRRIVAAHLEDNIEEFREAILPQEGQIIEDYINAVREGREWADHIEIEVLQRVFDRPIVVIDPDGQIRGVSGTEKKQ